MDKEINVSNVSNDIKPHTLRNPNPEILRYTTNKLSFWLVILSIVFNCLAFLDYYGKRTVAPDFFLGLDVVINILVLLACFVSAEEVKAYRKVFGFVSFGLAGVQVLRIFFIPLKYFKPLVACGSFPYLIVLYVLSAVCLILGGLICIYRSNILTGYLNSLKNAENKEGEVK